MAPTAPAAATPPTTAQPAGRAGLVDRILELGPGLQRRLSARLPAGLRAELGSVTVHQLETLGHLAQGARSMTDLARDLGVTESAATALADRLVRQGLAQRQADAADRRVVRLALSPRASKTIGMFKEAKRTATEDQLSALSDAQLSSLVDVLETLAADHPGPGGDGAEPAGRRPSPASSAVAP